MQQNNEKYRKLLLDSLERYYTPEQIEEFAWNVDQQTVETYYFDFADHEGNRKSLICSKLTGSVELKDAPQRRRVDRMKAGVGRL